MIRQLEEREKRALRRALGVKPMRHGAIVNHGDPLSKPKEHDHFGPWKANHKMPTRSRPGRCVLGGSKRAMVELRNAGREAFFASLGVKL